MEWSKLKNIILIILLLLNGFLLFQVVGQARRSAQYAEEARSGALEVLRSGGVEMSREALPQEADLPPLRCERSRDSEAQMAQALLGSALRTEGRDAYEGEKGEILFRSDGSFSATFLPGAWPLDGEEPQAHAQRLLEDAGYSCALLSAQEEEGGMLVTVEERLDGVSVFDHTAKLLYRGGCLLSLEGVRLAGPAEPASQGTPLDLPTLLVRFLAEVREGGYVCRAIESMTPGYRAVPETIGQTALTPVWQVETDSITFYLNALTGEIEPMGGRSAPTP